MAMEPKTTREAVLVTLAEVKNLRCEVRDLQKEVKELSHNYQQETLKCPFAPSREENGNELIIRVGAIEHQISKARGVILFIGIVAGGGAFVTGIWSLVNLVRSFGGG